MVRHPEIHIHRDKETFYFSTLGHPEHPRHRFEFLEDYLESFREMPLELLGKNYHALRRCGRFYRPKVRGDFTASYGVLPPGIIAEIIRMQPGLRESSSCGNLSDARGRMPRRISCAARNTRRLQER